MNLQIIDEFGDVIEFSQWPEWLKTVINAS